MDTQRITLDMPVDLNEAVNAAVKETSLSKAQYMRTAIELLNLLSKHKNAEVVVRDGHKEVQIVLPWYRN